MVVVLPSPFILNFTPMKQLTTIFLFLMAFTSAQAANFYSIDSLAVNGCNLEMWNGRTPPDLVHQLTMATTVYSRNPSDDWIIRDGKTTATLYDHYLNYPDFNTVDTWLDPQLLACAASSGGGIDSVVTDATLTGKGIPGDPLSVVGGGGGGLWEYSGGNLHPILDGDSAFSVTTPYAQITSDLFDVMGFATVPISGIYADSLNDGSGGTFVWGNFTLDASAIGLGRSVIVGQWAPFGGNTVGVEAIFDGNLILQSGDTIFNRSSVLANSLSGDKIEIIFGSSISGVVGDISLTSGGRAGMGGRDATTLVFGDPATNEIHRNKIQMDTSKFITNHINNGDTVIYFEAAQGIISASNHYFEEEVVLVKDLSRTGMPDNYLAVNNDSVGIYANFSNTSIGIGDGTATATARINRHIKTDAGLSDADTVYIEDLDPSTHNNMTFSFKDEAGAGTNRWFIATEGSDQIDGQDVIAVDVDDQSYVLYYYNDAFYIE